MTTQTRGGSPSEGPGLRERHQVDIPSFLAETARSVEVFLDGVLPPGEGFPPPLGAAIRYSALDGGKRLRPALTLAAAECLGGDRDRALPVAAALEMIHTYSLIHDDLPAMDDDTYRRGKLTCHKQFSEAAAILAGDSLLTQSFQVIGEADAIPADHRVRIVTELSSACGPAGLIGGQMADLAAAGGEVDLPMLEYIHTHKTGALIQAAVRCGGIAAGGSEKELRILGNYGRRAGLGFQIIDDILDVEGDPEETGKATGRDRHLGKATYPALFGVESSRQRAGELIAEAVQGLAEFGEEADLLRGLARFIGERSR
jgi:geranylgeranyl diphosphate synthase type II